MSINEVLEELRGITRYDVHNTKSQDYLQEIALDVALQWAGTDDRQEQRVALALYEAIGEIKELIAENERLMEAIAEINYYAAHSGLTRFVDLTNKAMGLSIEE